MMIFFYPVCPFVRERTMFSHSRDRSNNIPSFNKGFILNILLRRNLTIKKSLQMMNKKIISCLQHTYKEQPEDMSLYLPRTALNKHT